MVPQMPLREPEAANYEFFLDLPEVDRTAVKADVKGSQFLQPLFEYSGACAGCGETPYVKLLTQLFGDRMLIANATGCSSIYGGNLPTTPYAKDANGRGPAWSNSLFEDNAEFGFGFRLAVDQQRLYATQLVKELAEPIGERTWTGCSTLSRRTRRASPRSVSGSRPCGPSSPGSTSPEGAPARRYRRLPGEEERVDRSAATAGPTTSATAASTTSWPRAVTSTSWCSTPRCTPTPAARPPRPPRWRRRPSSP
jgi:hypothetical protein